MRNEMFVMKEDNHINELTRELMKDALESPSASFTMRVMKLVFQERKAQRPMAYVRSLPTPSQIIFWLAIYAVVIGGIGTYLHFNPINTEMDSAQLQNLWVVILTFSCAIPVYIIGICWEHRIEKRRK